MLLQINEKNAIKIDFLLFFFKFYKKFFNSKFYYSYKKVFYLLHKILKINNVKNK